MDLLGVGSVDFEQLRGPGPTHPDCGGRLGEALFVAERFDEGKMLRRTARVTESRPVRRQTQ